MDSVRVVLADDHPVVIEGLCRYFALQEDLVILATTGSYEALRAAVTAHEPDVVVVDLHMPGMAGADSIREILRPTTVSTLRPRARIRSSRSIFRIRPSLSKRPIRSNRVALRSRVRRI